ncbi:Fur family transcriptional regulator [Atopomonas sediminilitoris]|uniref:Fur family transcriptional regulator n=1 Tax=Atopomonas sediminilitoris TaxID=2919919 RepID=UPI001F4E3552|nr:Fur family transcriptional regulator [Atopomonas sediminilitoris]MCJ8170495.1 transcriptional repressor [Atopomonas sediminilitoris]
MSQAPLACRPHNHDHCVDHALQDAEQRCSARGVRLTELRKRVLELVWQSHQPLGAYDILEQLSQQDGRRPGPPTVYRALDFLLEQGLVHRLASLNAFLGCTHPEHGGGGQFLICRQCRVAVELEHSATDQAIAQAAASVGFAVEQPMVEVLGLCARCQTREGA